MHDAAMVRQHAYKHVRHLFCNLAFLDEECCRLQAEVHELTHWSLNSYLDLARCSLLDLEVHVGNAVPYHSKMCPVMQKL